MNENGNARNNENAIMNSKWYQKLIKKTENKIELMNKNEWEVKKSNKKKTKLKQCMILRINENNITKNDWKAKIENENNWMNKNEWEVKEKKEN